MNLNNINSRIQIGSLIRSANYDTPNNSIDEVDMCTDDKTNANEKKGTTSCFVELFWFICQNKSRYDNELELLTMSYNVTHGNVRFNGYLKAFDCYRNGALFINPKKITTNFAIYPSSLYKLRYGLQNGMTIQPIEQLYVEYDPERNPWQNELVRSFFSKDNDLITVNIKNSIGQEYIYRFDKLQTQMLYMACENVLNNGTIMSAFARKN